MRAGQSAVGIESWLAERLAVARRRWPDIRLGDDAFLRHLALHHRPADPALHLEDLFLTCACVSGDRAAIAALEAAVLARVPGWVSRFAVSGDEVQQLLRQKLLLGAAPYLLHYTGRGALERWAHVAATRTALNLQRQLKPTTNGEPLHRLVSSPDPELDFIKLRDGETLRGALREAMRDLPARSLSLLRLHYLEGVSLERLAVREKVHRATAARWLADARAQALESARTRLRQRLHLGESEGDSLVRLLASQLVLSLRGDAPGEDVR